MAHVIEGFRGVALPRMSLVRSSVSAVVRVPGPHAPQGVVPPTKASGHTCRTVRVRDIAYHRSSRVESIAFWHPPGPRGACRTTESADHPLWHRLRRRGNRRNASRTATVSTDGGALMGTVVVREPDSGPRTTVRSRQWNSREQLADTATARERAGRRIAAGCRTGAPGVGSTAHRPNDGNAAGTDAAAPHRQGHSIPTTTSGTESLEVVVDRGSGASAGPSAPSRGQSRPARPGHLWTPT